jgi:hypothetical protein
MAIYHANVKTFSRSKGHSSIAAAAYRAGILLEDPTTGARHDYRRRDGVVETHCIAPQDAPDWALVPAGLWAEAEVAERRRDSTVAREFEFALPHELEDEQRSALAVEVTRALVGRYGFAAQTSIHSPGSREGLNWHVHILATTRRMAPDGLAEKTRELDGGPSGRAEIEWVRELVADVTNTYLQAANISVRVDHRSLRQQADDALARGDMVTAAVLSREPTKHMGKDASAIERRGGRSRRGEQNRRTNDANEAEFEELLGRLERQGRAMAVPAGHSQQKATREVRRPPAVLTLSLFDGRIEMSRGLARLVEEKASPAEESSPEQVAAALESLRVDVVHQGVLLREDLVAHGLQATLGMVDSLATRSVPPDDGKEYRSGLSRLLTALRRFGAALVRFPRRLQAVRRAARLRHMAEQSWDDFVAHHPTPGVPWSTKEWEKRRGRRMAALEQRADELAAAQAAVTPEKEKACADELAVRAALLEALSEAFAARLPPRVRVTAIEAVREEPILDPARESPSPVPRRPRLH